MRDKKRNTGNKKAAESLRADLYLQNMQIATNTQVYFLCYIFIISAVYTLLRLLFGYICRKTESRCKDKLPGVASSL